MRRIDSVLREAGGQLSLLPQEHHRSSVASAPKALAPGEEIGSQLSLAECFEGGFNAFALGVARRATSQPERVPLLLLYGPPAVGKSRILQSVGHDLTAAGRKVLAVTAEGLMHEFVDSVRFDRMPRFRERYRGADTLLVDELAALETTQRRNPEKTQLELAQTVRALMLGGGKQIVFASAKPVIGRTDAGPRFLCFPEALGGVLVGALQVPLRTPIESEVAAFAKWFSRKRHRTELPDTVAEFLAQNARGSLRTVEGFVTRVVAYSQLTSARGILSVLLAEEVLCHYLGKEARSALPRNIVEQVAACYAVSPGTPEALRARKEKLPLHVACYLCRKLVRQGGKPISYPLIGEVFGMHHSTVMYAVGHIQKLLDTEEGLAGEEVLAVRVVGEVQQVLS